MTFQGPEPPDAPTTDARKPRAEFAAAKEAVRVEHIAVAPRGEAVQQQPVTSGVPLIAACDALELQAPVRIGVIGSVEVEATAQIVLIAYAAASELEGHKVAPFVVRRAAYIR